MTLEATIGTIFILGCNTLLILISQKIIDKVKIQENCIIDIICGKEEEKIIKNLIIKLANK